MTHKMIQVAAHTIDSTGGNPKLFIIRPLYHVTGLCTQPWIKDNYGTPLLYNLCHVTLFSGNPKIKREMHMACIFKSDYVTRFHHCFMMNG